MPNQIRTVDFLPEIFRTDINSQFMNASLDVLVQQPDFKRVEGFIGKKYGYGVASSDHYVVESDFNNNVRNKYQLNPSIVSLKPGTNAVKDIISYPGIIDALRLQGANVSRHDRLFSSDTYSWDPFVDLDKLVNYGQYYWMPYGPDAVEVNSGTVLLNAEYTIEDTPAGIHINDIDALNPTINLVRGGSYSFTSDGPFFIQTSTAFSMNPLALNKSVLGVANNGSSRVLYEVPTADDLEEFNLPVTQFVDLVDNRGFADINGSNIFDLNGIDGVTGVDGKILLIYDRLSGLDLSTNGTFYTISLDPLGGITLEEGAPITNMEAIYVRSGVEYAGAKLYRDTRGLVQVIPSFANKMYYRSGRNPTSIGVINLVEADRADILEVESDIIGQTSYVSSNGVTLTNGLKITFTDNVSPTKYANNTYYVEGVGTSISLWNVKDYIAPELNDNILYNPWSANPWDSDHWDADYYVPVRPDYITISRDDRSYNAWSRSNRWSHQSVLDETTKHNGVATKRYNNTPVRAVRPIIEFEPNLALFNNGTSSLGPITIIDTVETDALSNIVGRSTADGYIIDNYRLSIGDRIVFAADSTASTRASVFVVDVLEVNGVEVYNLTADINLSVVEGCSVIILAGKTLAGSTYSYNNGTWSLSQRKITTNVAPLFDLFDKNGISFGNTDYYESTLFSGCALFSYTPGTGPADPVLNFPIKYSNINNIGDINFTVSYEIDSDSLGGAYVHQITTSGHIKRNGWINSANESTQRQIFEFGTVQNRSEFKIDVPVSSSSSIDVYVGGNLLTASDFLVTINANSTVVTLASAVSNEAVTILALSNVASIEGYYDYPTNITSNPFNGNVTSLDIGDLRNQYTSIFKSVKSLTGDVFGTNNYHDSGKLLQYGSEIIKNSASLVLPGLFLRNKNYDLFDALEFNSREYTNYKSLLIEMAQATDYSVYQTPNDILDNVIDRIVSIRGSNKCFYWTDMLPAGSPYAVNQYVFRNNIDNVIIDLSKFYDYDVASYNGLSLYLVREIDGISTTIQLIRGVDYTVSDINSTVTVTKLLYTDDKIIVKEYNQTYGSYCPATPTKLGLYPAFIPEVVLDETAIPPTHFIRGHDGSYTKLWGTYENGILNDFRDIVLLEFEQRIYNNLKVDINPQNIPLRLEDVVPGAFRTTDYTWEEIQSIYSMQFLNWIGANRIDYVSQQYIVNDQRTYNYNQSTSRIDRQQLKQGAWRGLNRYYYDAENPAAQPWQMLGFTDKPDYWDSRYGAAPYTSDNTVMWEEIASGYVHGTGVVEKYIRPELLNVLPVDSRGTLVSPMQSVVGNYNSLSFNRDWAAGDCGPAEASYLRSSSWPFDAMRILALTKPAKFFNYFADVDRFRLDGDTDQYLYDGSGHLDPRKLVIYGNGEAKHSYINWIIDYVAVRGADGTSQISEMLSNSDVRLSYNLGGFSSKDYLKFYVERATPDSSNRGLLIPDENYSILLYDNVPSGTIVYSSILIQKTQNGYKVWGNSQSKLYFIVTQPKTSKNRSVTVADTTVYLSTDFYSDRFTTIAYGTEFYSIQSLCEFIQNYGRYLELSGVKFENINNGVSISWQRMVEEMIYWDAQQWELNSTISLNPNATSLVIDKAGFIAQPLKLEKNNFILNQQLLPLQSENVNIVRDGNRFIANVLSPGDSVAFTQINLHNVEHVVVFDNLTVFNDVIWNLNSGLRQTRLVIRGSVTNNYQGYIDAAGFVLNEDNIIEWNQSTKYTRGSIVTHKNNYYSAVSVVEPNEVFDMQQWQLINYDAIKTGLLPNPSTTAYESLYYYDSYRANLKLEGDLLGFSLIGYRPRPYFAYTDLSDITQVNLYKNMIRMKGTPLATDGLRNLTFNQSTLDYVINENWAIREGDFGAAISSNFVEFTLSRTNLNSNPSVVAFIDDTNTDVEYSNEIININDAINYEVKPESRDFMPLYDGRANALGSSLMLPSAGYVHLDDVDFTEYTYGDLNNNSDNHANLVRGNYIWIPNINNTWDILSPITVGTTIIKATSSQSGQLMFTFAAPHGLKTDDRFVVLQFNDSLNGYYTVSNVRSLTEIMVSLTGITNTDSFNLITVTGEGVAFKLISHRVTQPTDIAPLVNTGINATKLFWSDTDSTGPWSVYKTSESYVSDSLPPGVVGTVAAYSENIGYLIGSPSTKTVYLYNNEVSSSIDSGFNNYGKVIKIIGNTVFIVSDVGICIFDSRMEPIQDIFVDNITDLVGSSDGRWIYASRPELNIVYIYKRLENGNYAFASSIVDGDQSIQSYGTSIATTVDGTKLIVGSPYETVVLGDTIFERAGQVFVYARYQQNFESDGGATYSLSDINPDDIDVYVNDVLVPAVNYSLNSTTITFNNNVAVGSIVRVEGTTLTLVATLTSDAPYQDALYGNSVATNRYGAEILVGCPYDLSPNPATQLVNGEGAVYRYTNSGQRYGAISMRGPSPLAGDFVFINGFKVTLTPDTLDGIAAQINTQSGDNVLAIADSSTNAVLITTANKSVDAVNDIVDVVGDAARLTRLGITPYVLSQVIRSPQAGDNTAFGTSISMSSADSLVIGASNSTDVDEATFDGSASSHYDFTIFDHGATQFVDGFDRCGAAYVYDYLPATNASETNHGQYAYGQNLRSSADRRVLKNYGASVSHNDSVIFVSDGTSVTPFNSSNGNSSWSKHRGPLSAVDINKLHGISIYDTDDNRTLAYLDYIDSDQGKLLGVITENLDHATDVDPAGYYGDSAGSNVNTAVGSIWLDAHVGRTWLDTSTVRMLNTHQTDLQYNSENWSRAHPRSTAVVYTWIESLTTPVNHSGAGFPYSYDQYNTGTRYDSSIDNTITVYYYWVRGLSFAADGKKISPAAISSYILNPRNSGIPFLAPLTTHTIALYNATDALLESGSAIHLGYGGNENTDSLHTVWRLIQEGDASDFVPGLPDKSAGSSPSRLYLKLLDSLVGVDGVGLPVPDTSLPALVQFGTKFRPRQTMFTNREVALQNVVDYANGILISLPVTEIRDLSDVSESLSSGSMRFVNYWTAGYSDATKPRLEVQYYSDLLRIVDNQLEVGTESNLFLEEGVVVRVANNNLGKSETYVYTNASWVRVGLSRGTIQLSANELSNASDLRSVLRWLFETCYTDELLMHRNATLVLLFGLAQSGAPCETNYMPWLTKTSLVNVNQTVRQLLPYPKLQRDNTELLQGYINEVKPYHVYVADYVFSYAASDDVALDVTDFDLPARYNSATGRFESPRLVYQPSYDPVDALPSDAVWSDREYTQWFTNYGLSCDVTTGESAVVATLTADIALGDTTLPVSATESLAESGTITIGNELMTYSGVDRLRNLITGVYRGADERGASSHNSGAAITATSSSALVIDSGRDYLLEPRVTVEYAGDGEPRREMKLHATMSLGSVVGIRVEDAGDGYPSQPRIHIEPSITVEFSAVNADNSITIEDHPLRSGDAVRYCGRDDAGMIDGEYYYVRVIDLDTVALYQRYDESVEVRKTNSADARVAVSRSGGTLGVTARAIINVSAQPVRNFKTTLLFDRVTYRAGLTPTNDNAIDRIIANYKPTVNMPDTLPQLMSGLTYPNAVTQGAEFSLGAGWDQYNWAQQPWDRGTGDITPFLDAIIESPPMRTDSDEPGVSEHYDVDGGAFDAGYAPEELVAGIVTDRLELAVMSDDFNNDADVPNIDPSFRISLDRSGIARIYNTNSANRTALDADWLGGNTIVLEDIIRVVSIVDFENVPLDWSDNTLLIDGVDTGRVTRFEVIDPATDELIEGCEWITGEVNKRVGPGQLWIKLPAGAPYTAVNVRFYVGNLVYLNGEYIGFSRVDPVTNSISGLRRGAVHTYTAPVTPENPTLAGTVVYGVRESDQLPNDYYNQWWFGAHTSGYDVNLDNAGNGQFDLEGQGFEYGYYDRVQLKDSVHPAAAFLQNNDV